tara:strand:+ start:31013 stop:31138 length:126 start_codon:yes stop_codon:yes gene_type:complete
MYLTVTITVLLAEGHAKLPEPLVVFNGLACPKGARMFLMNR